MYDELLKRIESLERKVKKLEAEQFPEVMNKVNAMKYLFKYKDYASWNSWVKERIIQWIVVGEKNKYPKKLLDQAVDLAIERRLEKAREIKDRLNQRRKVI